MGGYHVTQEQYEVVMGRAIWEIPAQRNGLRENHRPCRMSIGGTLYPPAYVLA